MIHRRRSRIADILRPALPPAIIAFFTVLLLGFPPAQYSFYPQCPIYQLFHLQCPGCGATRALVALLRGHFADAISLNALVPLLLPFAVAYGILCYSRLLRRKPLLCLQVPSVILYAAFAAAAVFTVVRNLPLHSL